MQEATKNNLMISAAIILAGIIIAAAIVLTANNNQSKVVEEVGPAKVAQENKESKKDTQKNEAARDLSDKIFIDKNSHIRGNPNAPVTIVEYSDLQCPFCKRFHPTVKQVLEKYPDKVRWVYKHFPLDSIHSQATPAAEASECVAEQKGNDGFWEFVDGILENQSRIGQELYKELASEIGVDMNQFEDCVSSRKYKDKVRKDYQEGVFLGVRGTPGSFVNGEEVSGAVPYEYLESVVEEILSENK